MDWSLVLNAVATMCGLTFALATLLAIANGWLRVEEDPRVGIVQQMLPHTNCGACGFPGCHAFAEALVRGETLPGKCSVGTVADHARIAEFLGVDVGNEERRVARLSCAGGTNVARNRAHYEGPDSCASAALVAGGGKACFWGCLGRGDCERACDFDAIAMNRHGLPVVSEDCCTACGDCVVACPKDLFSLHAVSHRLWVACASLAEGDEILEDCEVACTGCARCATDAPGQIRMREGLPVIDFQAGPFTAGPIQRCPTGAIVWIDQQLGVVKGRSAHKIVRQGERHEGGW